MRRRSRQDDQPLLEAALESGDLVEAGKVLLGIVRSRRDRRERALACVELASLHMLTGDLQGTDARSALTRARQLDSAVVAQPLYRALHWEAAALDQAPAREVRTALRDFEADSGTAHYHAASAHFMVGSKRGALKHLQRALAAGLPKHVLWRCHSLKGYVHEQAGQWELAAESIEAALNGAPEAERQVEKLALASVLLELNEAAQATAVLDSVEDAHLTELQ